MDHPPKFPSTWHWPWSPQVHKDDRVHRNPDIFIGPEIVITEKLDGGNTCLWQGEVYARSMAGKARDGWFAMVRKHHAWKSVISPKDMAIYGEDLFGIHSIEYNPMREDETYFVFKIREGDYWHGIDGIQERCQKMELQTVPVLYRGSFRSTVELTDWMEERIKQPSTKGPFIEGFVISWADGYYDLEFQDKTAKYVRKDHVQTDEHWRVNWQPCKLLKE